MSRVALDMPTAAYLSRRIANTELALRSRTLNGELALELEQNLIVFRQQLAMVLALTAGVATCA